jgi:hypothetical protein
MTLSNFLGKELAAEVCSRSFEKRSSIAVDIELMVDKAYSKSVSDPRRWSDECAKSICTELTQSIYSNVRAGGLVSLASIAAGSRGNLLNETVSRAVRTCCGAVVDEDSKVRFTACEALFNVLRFCKAPALYEFACIFESLGKLSVDTDMEIRQVTSSLDRQLREIVIEHLSCGGEGIQITKTIESCIVHPNVIMKQMCLNWVDVIRPLKSAGFHERLNVILPSLFSILCSDTANLSGSRDLYVYCDRLLSRILLDIETHREIIPQETIDACMGILVKYGQLQESLTSTKMLQSLFEWIRVFANKTISGSFCAHIVMILIRSLDFHGRVGPVGDSIIATHEYLLKSEKFTDHLLSAREELSRDLETTLPKLQSRVYITEAVISWLSVVCKGKEGLLVSLDVFFALTLNRDILSLCYAQFSVQAVARRLVEYSTQTDDKKRLASLIVSSVSENEDLKGLLEIFSSESPDSQFVFEFFRAILVDPDLQSVWDPKLVDACISSKIRKTCPVAAIGLAIHAGRYEVLESIVRELNSEHSAFFDEFCDMLESETFSMARLAILEQPTLAKALVRMNMHMNQKSRAFQVLFNRLQLVGIFKSVGT